MKPLKPIYQQLETLWFIAGVGFIVWYNLFK